MLRFAWPGDETAGATIAAPLRALAPAMADTIGVLPAQRYDEIHSDPTTPTMAWINGTHHGPLDQKFATIWLARFGSGTNSPFSLAELRHTGSPATVAGPRDDAVAGSLELVGAGSAGPLPLPVRDSRAAGRSAGRGSSARARLARR